ncbi:MAG TPA: transcription antitermination factor NusB [Gordonia sp. (in: high G+C Gram-positive bacteria)]|uniref:transcription antitermination factor NusB n=1 Tax=unclassified Gordonia (in: high G+C Gram-positive bacteria) TaxID=2657482 RepID=UPI000FAE3EC8|nr:MULTISPECIES: transcription antitermination factor NusB [unclassified Gordonia (in: high G+C Gram-positive bacteria)]RUP35600.1 MAG: transcription antitermination factor NusB [Gordonia sp. (in: high G+C Gram-positive bacteria)]HNP58880.1 transcription antitermination factor NusB [Gordonia sp. (in: high G+C Gram-positive bacteria)]HRC52606.1 transcription antitermination factor NusB [Gordonia sp. (in: high G+C Gram-positive bacteria)]
MKHSGTRHKARNRAVDLLFEAEAKGVSPLDLIEERRTIYIVDDSVGTVHDYTATAVAGFAQDQAQVDAVISSHLDKWQLDRLPAVDRAILRLATWELFNATDVDTVVIVDEAVQLAKELSTDNSPAFVNGVLAKIAELAPQVRSAAAAQPQEAVED